MIRSKSLLEGGLFLDLIDGKMASMLIQQLVRRTLSRQTKDALFAKTKMAPKGAKFVDHNQRQSENQRNL